MIRITLATIALSIAIAGCSVTSDTGANLTEEKVKSSLQNCLEHKSLTSVGPIIMKDKNQAEVTFKFEVNALNEGKKITQGSATYNLDSKGAWYMTGVLSDYDLCENRLPINAK